MTGKAGAYFRSRSQVTGTLAQSVQARSPPPLLAQHRFLLWNRESLDAPNDLIFTLEVWITTLGGGTLFDSRSLLVLVASDQIQINPFTAATALFVRFFAQMRAD